MESEVAIAGAADKDVTEIVSILRANRGDLSMFLRSAADVRKNLKDFIVAKDPTGRILGCAALHQYSSTLGEVLSVAVLPEFQGQGIGNHLVQYCMRQARLLGIKHVWLATAKPDYFARFGFRPFSRWALPTSVIMYKLKQVLQQPAIRWFPAIFGEFTFMEKKE